MLLLLWVIIDLENVCKQPTQYGAQRCMSIISRVVKIHSKWWTVEEKAKQNCRDLNILFHAYGHKEIWLLHSAGYFGEWLIPLDIQNKGISVGNSTHTHILGMGITWKKWLISGLVPKESKVSGFLGHCLLDEFYDCFKCLWLLDLIHCTALN